MGLNYSECASCKHLIDCKVKEYKTERCINYEQRVDKASQSDTRLLDLER